MARRSWILSLAHLQSFTGHWDVVFPALAERAYARLADTELTVCDCPFKNMWSPWDTARAVRRWSLQDQGSYAMALIQWGSASAQPCADSSRPHSCPPATDIDA